MDSIFLALILKTNKLNIKANKGPNGKAAVKKLTKPNCKTNC